jgi:hypothetical protein
MLLNEFLKEHGKVEEQQAAIAQLKALAPQQQKQIEAPDRGFTEGERAGRPQQTCTTNSRQPLNINSNFVNSSDRLTRP